MPGAPFGPPGGGKPNGGGGSWPGRPGVPLLAFWFLGIGRLWKRTWEWEWRGEGAWRSHRGVRYGLAFGGIRRGDGVDDGLGLLLSNFCMRLVSI